MNPEPVGRFTPASGRVRAASLKVVVLLVIVGISCLLLEQCVRFYLFGFNSLNYKKMNSFHNIGVSGMIKPSPYLPILYELKPNLQTYFKFATFTTSSQGLRDKEYPLQKPDRAFRVAVIGDSMVMGSGVTIENTFHSLLEDRLNRESAGLLYELINFGVGGYDPHQYLATLKLRAMAYKPDLVLFCLCGPFDNGFQPKKDSERKYQVLPTTYPFFQSFTLILLDQILMSRFPDWQRVDSATSETPLEEKHYFEAIYSELSSISKQNNLPICIVVLGLAANREEVAESGLLADIYALHFIDTTMAFYNKRQSDYWVNRIDGHPNSKANEIFAQIIYTYLKEQHLL